MANIKKTFNFRNGVQVDDDNLIVNATGLVGIGTTIPNETLDVRGTAKVVGLVTSQEGFVGVFTAHTSSLGTVALSTSIIGAGVSIKSGIITSNAASGLVTYYGDARFLQGMPTSQWEDTNAGLGVSSIYNTGGTVGVGTTSPQFTLQVGSNVNGGEHGVGISSAGDIKASGIVTATGLDINGNVSISGGSQIGNLSVAGVSTFIGNITGRVIGDVVGNINSGVSTITTLNATNVNIAGLSTHRVAFTNASDNLTDSEDLTFNDTTNTLNVVGTTDTDQLNVSGVSTFQNSILFVGAGTSFATWDKSESRFEFTDHAGLSFGNSADLLIYHDGSANLIKSGGQINLATATGEVILGNTAGAVGVVYKKDDFVEIRDNNTKRFRTNGIGVTVYNQLDTTNIVASGVVTATTELNSPLVGVGTDAPATDIQVRKLGAAQIRVTSDTDAAIVSVGRVAGAGNGTNAAFRYGNNSVGYPYSHSNAVDIINYDTGNINFYLNGSATGNFYWHKGSNGSRLLTLTNTGRLGIGSTAPTQALDVDGSGVFTGSVTVYNQTVNNNLTVNNDLTVNGALNSNVTGNVTGDLTGNVNATTGISTFRNIYATQGIGIGAVATDLLPFRYGIVSIDKRGALAGIGSITVKYSDGAAVTASATAVDFAEAGDVTSRFMVPPKVSNTERGNLTGLIAGAMIYNTNLNKLQVYTGSAWETVTSS